MMLSTRSLIALLLALATVLATSCANRQKGVEYEYLRLTVDGQETLGIAGKDKLIRAVVVYFHDAGDDEFATTADEAHSAVTSALVNAGFAVVASKASGDAWGNAVSQRNYVFVGGTAAQHYRTENVFFLADGMGAIAAANLLASGPTVRVRGFAAINPVFDLKAVAPQFESTVAKIYPDASIHSVNPMALPFNAFKGKAMRFYVSPDDQVVRSDANARAFAARFGSVADISVVDCASKDGYASCYQGDDIVKWFSEQEKRS
jgi:hypothetical protein